MDFLTAANDRINTLYDKFDISNDELGQGAFSVVKLATHRVTGDKVAIKCIQRNDHLTSEDVEAIIREADVMSRLSHRNIVKLIDFIQEDRHFYFVLEYCPGGELFDRLVKKTFYNEEEARDTVRTICDAIQYCHDRNIVHRDLKPENLLMTSDNDDASVKIADFGFAAPTIGNSLTTACGTPGYVAPELLRSQLYGTPVDMWAIGVITYCLLGGYPPFDDENEKRMFKKIKAGKYEFHEQYWSAVSEEAKNFIAMLLQIDPSQRYTASQALSHPWLQTNGGELSARDLGGSLRQLQIYQAKRKFRGAANAIMAINRMSILGRCHISDATARTTCPDTSSDEPEKNECATENVPG